MKSNVVKLLLGSLILFSSYTEVISQTLGFGVFFGNKEIGHIKAERSSDHDLIMYNVISEVEYHSWLYNYQRSTQLSAIYHRGKLQQAFNKISEGGDLKDHRTTENKGDIYICFKHPDDQFKLNYPISASCAILYFSEPKGITRIFSEGYQVMCDLQSIGEHTYRLSLPDGKINEYTYKNGRLVEVKVPRRWFTIYFRQRN